MRGSRRTKESKESHECEEWLPAPGLTDSSYPADREFDNAFELAKKPGRQSARGLPNSKRYLFAHFAVLVSVALGCQKHTRVAGSGTRETKSYRRRHSKPKRGRQSMYKYNDEYSLSRPGEAGNHGRLRTPNQGVPDAELQPFWYA